MFLSKSLSRLLHPVSLPVSQPLSEWFVFYYCLSSYCHIYIFYSKIREEQNGELVSVWLMCRRVNDVFPRFMQVSTKGITAAMPLISG